jgi:alkyl sulfatase BDS1-like metallo-beta-lactamase superfamily hydrolase
VAMAVKNVVFADPDNKDAKELLADTYEQMGYQSESGPWRSIYLQGAYELRNGVPTAGGTVTASADTIRAMTPDLLFDYLGVRLNGEKAGDKKITLNIDFTDLNQKYALMVENGTLNYESKPADAADATLTLTKSTLDDINLGTTTLQKAIDAGDVKLDGNEQSVTDFLGMLDTFPFWFNIVTP